MMHICDLPPNILVQIFKFLNKSDLLFSASKTCTLWNQLSGEKILWKKVDAVDFHDYAFTAKSFVNLLTDVQESVEELVIDLFIVNLIDIKHAGLCFPNLKYVVVKKPNSFKDWTSADEYEGYNWFKECYPNLRSLHLHQVNDMPIPCDAFKNLEELSFTNRHGSLPTSSENLDKYFEFLTSHKQLRKIVLSNCIVLPKAVKLILTQYPGLEILELQGTQCSFDEVNESTSADEVQLQSLNMLNVSETNIGDRLLEKIARKAISLKYLNIENCSNVTYAGIDAVARSCLGLHTLVINDSVESGVLDFVRCPLTTAGIQRIGECCHALSVLRINHCPEVGDAGVYAITNTCQELTELLVAGCLSLQDLTVIRLVERCPKLKKLDLGECVQLSENSVKFVLKYSKFMKKLSISTCHRVTGLQLVILDGEGDVGSCKQAFIQDLMHEEEPVHIKKPAADEQGLDANESVVTCSMDSALVQPVLDHSLLALENHSHISVLDLSFCSKITNADIKQIASFCPDLRDLDIQACYMVTNAGVKHLVQNCKLLQVLNISGGSISQTSRLTDGCLVDIVKYGENLEKLTVVKNFNITVDGVFLVIQNCERIHCLRVEISSRSNITKEMLVQMSGNVKNKTTCLLFKGDAEILVYKDAEFKLRKQHGSVL